MSRFSWVGFENLPTPRELLARSGVWEVPVDWQGAEVLVLAILYQAYYDSLTAYPALDPVAVARHLADIEDQRELEEDTLFHEDWATGWDELSEFLESEWCERLLGMVRDRRLARSLHQGASQALQVD